jgi:hypothetical protein
VAENDCDFTAQQKKQTGLQFQKQNKTSLSKASSALRPSKLLVESLEALLDGSGKLIDSSAKAL